MLRSNRALATLAAATALSLGVAACGSDASMQGPLPADVAAQVGDHEVATDTLDAIVTNVVSQPAPGATAAPTPSDDDIVQAERSVLSSLIQTWIVVDLAAENGVELTEEEAQAAYEDRGEQAEQERADFGLSEQEYLDYVVVPSQLVIDLGEQVGEALPEEEVRAAFDQQFADGGEVATVSHILVETEGEASDALARIEDGESFEDVASDVSIDPSASQGGALGENVPLSNYVEPFAEAASEAPLGEVVGPVETQFGFHLIRVDERGEIAFEDREEDLRAQAAQAEIQAMLTEAISEADVVVPTRLGVWDPATGSIQAEAPASGTDAPATPLATPTE